MRVCRHFARPSRCMCGQPFRSMFKSKARFDHCTDNRLAPCTLRNTSTCRQVAATKSAVNTGPETLPQRQSVFLFGTGSRIPDRGERTDDGNMEQLLGGKGQNLADMSRLGLRVPPGFTVSTSVCAEYHKSDNRVPQEVWSDIMCGIAEVGEMMGQRFGDTNKPLLVSIRSGAEVSMPGMTDTVLNLGLNDQIAAALASKAGERFAWDTYRRFLGMFGNVVLGLTLSDFEQQLEAVKGENDVRHDESLSADQLREVVRRYKQVYHTYGHVFPEQPEEQLRLAVQAVFSSWESESARLYRSVNGITGLAGNAVTVQAMVFGNLGSSSGTGVCFTRNPSTGKRQLYGEYLVNAQGEDVVTGRRTPYNIEHMCDELPAAYQQLTENCEIVEREYKDMQDIEFTIQEGSLYMLQCRSGKRTGQAAVAIACDFVDEGLVGIPAAVMMVEPRHLDQLLHPQVDSEESYSENVVAQGLPASPGAAVGKIAFDSDMCERMVAAGEPVVLLRRDTTPEDFVGMHGAKGVLTQLGGMTSHAAVAARSWGKPCITGCSALRVDEAAEVATLGGVQVKPGDVLSLNGSTGEVIMGAVPVAPARLNRNVHRFLSWVDEYRTVGVLANADTPADAKLARENGAEGIGLARTEHMFFASDERISAVRRMIFARTTAEREAALLPIEEFQREDFEAMFAAMDGLPMTIRLLDPPLHEFLPAVDDAAGRMELAEDIGVSVDDLERSIEAMQEVNPMLGFRGCRLGIAYPEIPRAQVRAIVRAACAAQDAGVAVLPGIMVPLVSSVAEYDSQAQLIHEVAQSTLREIGTNLRYQVGTMIETPRAALLAGKLAATAEFFSLGTNDLTQMTYGLSRDDVGRFLNMYISDSIMPADPFQVLDTEGVGQLIAMAISRGRDVNPELKVGLCGEQGGEPSSVAYLSSIGVDYVSCSAFRVPIARLSAAQAVIMAERSQ
eukprot:jgi/Ulvmu1/4793/UM020_0078.1